QHLAALNLNGTAMEILGTGTVVHTGTLTTATTSGFIDVGVNALIVDNPGTSATPGSYVPGLVATGYAGGLWNGLGIRSYAAMNDSPKQHAVGYGSAASILNLSGVQTGLFMGETVAAGAMLVRYTVYGDADLNGTADFNDFLRVQNNFGAASTTWDRGDFNFDGTTDFNDFLALQNAFGLMA
ncbi:MAG: hypothetical protein JWM57_3111, partial [Phycisphaerales bacterium]|nr:hypothetical protein [Phycisphaerales bacterium]